MLKQIELLVECNYVFDEGLVWKSDYGYVLLLLSVFVHERNRK